MSWSLRSQSNRSVGKLPKAFQRGGGDPINAAVLPVEARKEEHPAILRESCRIRVARGIESLSHVDRRGPAAMSVIETDEEISATRHARTICRARQ